MGIFVTKSYLPPFEEYEAQLSSIWKTDQLTNQGPLVRKLDEKLQKYLDLTGLQVVTNGTIALQIALRALEIKGAEVITTPFSYVASTSAILWEDNIPVFADIDPNTYCINPAEIEKHITPSTKAILAVHVFDNPCDVDAIEAIAKKHELKVIYDAAHAFGVKLKGKSLLSYGDISTCSFHATKVFHTVEGGCVVAQDQELFDRLNLIKRFGHHGDTHYLLGINAKLSEAHAAMGLAVLPHMDEIIRERKAISEYYDELLHGAFERPVLADNIDYNYSYYPIVMETEQELNDALKRLSDEEIFPRRYFYPSLNTLPYLNKHDDMPVSESIASRILCLPLFPSLSMDSVKKISNILLQ